MSDMKVVRATRRLRLLILFARFHSMEATAGQESTLVVYINICRDPEGCIMPLEPMHHGGDRRVRRLNAPAQLSSELRLKLLDMAVALESIYAEHFQCGEKAVQVTAIDNGWEEDTDAAGFPMHVTFRDVRGTCKKAATWHNSIGLTPKVQQSINGMAELEVTAPVLPERKQQYLWRSFAIGIATGAFGIALCWGITCMLHRRKYREVVNAETSDFCSSQPGLGVPNEDAIKAKLSRDSF
mmetsp:Transcript_7207/g.11739  ORF Transcript_7207/g.11739 Transcript_7207/m.11739 type:complete len:240 (-) Transcript_7207:249-968(-)